MNNCVYCGVTANTVDHVIPISWFKAGKRKKCKANHKKNLVACCRECNMLASNKVQSEKKENIYRNNLNEDITGY
jgi:5-methylcytosine-specific restriction endonuclease McrA